MNSEDIIESCKTYLKSFLRKTVKSLTYNGSYYQTKDFLLHIPLLFLLILIGLHILRCTVGLTAAQRAEVARSLQEFKDSLRQSQDLATAKMQKVDRRRQAGSARLLPVHSPRDARILPIHNHGDARLMEVVARYRREAKNYMVRGPARRVV